MQNLKVVTSPRSSAKALSNESRGLTRYGFDRSGSKRSESQGSLPRGVISPKNSATKESQSPYLDFETDKNSTRKMSGKKNEFFSKLLKFR